MLVTLTRYKQWANDLFLQQVATLTPEQMDAPQAVYFGSLRRTLHHVMLMDHVWRCHLLGLPHAVTSRNPADCPSFIDIAKRSRELDHWLVEYSRTLPDEEGVEPVQFPFIDGGSGLMPRHAMIAHMVNHTTYHRGHMAAMVYDFGLRPVATDLPVFLCQDQA